MPRRRPLPDPDQADLFSPGVDGRAPTDPRQWPPADRFPLNATGRSVRPTVWNDLVDSRAATVVAGYASIGELIDLIAEWHRREHDGELHVLLGAEPFPTARATFRDATVAFTREVRHYWLDEQGVDVDQSTRLVSALEASRTGKVRVRFIHGPRTLHAKIYVGTTAATSGSSNFTRAGLDHQYEVNSRFESSRERERYDQLVRVATLLWEQGIDWDEEFRALLEAMLRFTGWRDALARAGALLLEGDWARRYIGGLATSDGLHLWPSQVAGIAEALWIIENVGSVLVADATGSGKTRMGAHLIRAIRDRVWATGRTRSDLAVLVCPPAVERTWDREAAVCGLSITTVSHGLLSRAGDDQRPDQLLHRAQILAVDEAHHYLNPASVRTRSVRSTNADHVALFTATPINRGAPDLLQLVGLLGADNFEDETLAILNRLERRRTRDNWLLTAAEVEQLRREIRRFTVRRTKAELNELVDLHPEAYRHPVSGGICRYPGHEPRTYATGESPDDEAIAQAIRVEVVGLIGIVRLERAVEVPFALRREFTDARWLEQRLAAIHGLAAHQLLATMRSSRAALVEHLAGTDEAVGTFDLERFKPAPTGDAVGRLDQLAEEGPPAIRLECELPRWLSDAGGWRSACGGEAIRYRRIHELALQLSDRREQAKAELLATLAGRHRLVLAFDQHLITLALLRRLLDPSAAEVVMATGSDTAGRGRVVRIFARDSQSSAIALCSDAMNEGLNLQGASAVVHLDLPTTLRVAEQRIGRVDRMDSPHSRIEAWWPDDGPAFATRSNELLIRRTEESAELLGSNLPMPAMLRSAQAGGPVNVRTTMQEAERYSEERYDGISDALAPVRALVAGPGALIPPELYAVHASLDEHVGARLSAVVADSPWAFFAISGGAHGAPKWMLLDGLGAAPMTDVDVIAQTLRRRLEHDPDDRPFDESANHDLRRFVAVAARHERRLLPRRHLRALNQMSQVTDRWAAAASARGRFQERNAWQALHDLAAVPTPDEPHGDLFEIAERWLGLVGPLLESVRASRRRPYVLVSEITPLLLADPLPLEAVETAMDGVRTVVPLAQRISACILGTASNPPVLSHGPSHGSR